MREVANGDPLIELQDAIHLVYKKSQSTKAELA